MADTHVTRHPSHALRRDLRTEDKSFANAATTDEFMDADGVDVAEAEEEAVEGEEDDTGSSATASRCAWSRSSPVISAPLSNVRSLEAAYGRNTFSITYISLDISVGCCSR